MNISVIIPFYNRSAALRQTLAGFCEQSIEGSQFEVIVIDDGSIEGTGWIEETQWPFAMRLLHQENRGPAAARNLGGKSAQGEILLFLDCDIIPDQQLLATHSEIHRQFPDLLVAGVVFPYRNEESCLLDRLVDWQLGDSRLIYCWPADSELVPIPFYDITTQHISLHRDAFGTLKGFDEELRGNEDVEFGYRAAMAGQQVVFAQAAIGYHNHSRNLQERCRRHRFYPRFRPLLIKKHPGIRALVPGWQDEQPVSWSEDSPVLIFKKFERRFLALPPILSAMRVLATMLERRGVMLWLLHWLYWRLILTYEYLGFRDGIRDLGNG